MSVHFHVWFEQNFFSMKSDFFYTHENIYVQFLGLFCGNVKHDMQSWLM